MTSSKESEAIAVALVKALAPLERLSAEVAGALVPLMKALAPLEGLHVRIAEVFARNESDILKSAERWLEICRNAQAFVEALPQHMRIACSELAAQGWYIDGDFGAEYAGDLVRALRAERIGWVNEQLIADYRQRLPEIKAVLFERYPHRERILRAAFGAHERDEYELSVPIFLIQADGICFDVTKNSMFMRDRKSKRPAIAQYAETFTADAFHSAVLSPLTVVHAIALSEKERPEGFDGLNRHQVLHGEVAEYNTELNSYKAISLLSYLSWVLHMESSG